MSRDQNVMMLLPSIEKCLMDFIKELFLMPKFDKNSTSVTREKDLSGDHKVMGSLPPEVEYPMEPVEWGLPAVQVWCY